MKKITVGIIILFININIISILSTAYTPSNMSGHILFSPIDSTTTYLIDTTGSVYHTWASSYLPGVAVYWIGNGVILRTIRVGSGIKGGGGGGVQKITWDNSITWDFRYNTNGNLSHHDIEPLPNGNVLMIAWETKTRTEAINAGMNPSYVDTELMPDHIIEVQPTGSTSGTIVWEWHVWDHLIQDYDSTKANYGIVKDHPELVNINYPPYSMKSDWMHTNSIDYNPHLDQIMISVRDFNEIWVIDHSTTTAQAKSHTGGRSGKGGDLLYRWGNPAAYNMGTVSDQKLFDQHDAQWITDGCPGAGHILIFNNGPSRIGDKYTSIDEIIPPVNAQGVYSLSSGVYGPETVTWNYSGIPALSFYSIMYSGAERLSNGNTLICDGMAGRFFEIASSGATVWSYTNLYPLPIANNVFKICYVSPDEILPDKTNNPPDSPNNPNPPDSALDVPTNTSLRWNCIDPDNDPLTYDIYFGCESPLQKIAGNVTTSSYPLELLLCKIQYHWRVVAWDNHGASTSSPTWSFMTVGGANNPPFISITSPVSDTIVSGVLNIYGVSSDIDGTVMKVEVCIDDGEWCLADGATSWNYNWDTTIVDDGFHMISVRCKDNNNSYSVTATVSIIVKNFDNKPPSIPDTPVGKTTGVVKQEYSYATSTTDPDGDQIYYFWDWGDETNSGWIGAFDSNRTINETHIWNEEGIYVVKVKAKDIYGEESVWSDPLSITMPYTYKSPFLRLLEWLFQRFPHAFPLLRHLKGY